MLTLTNGMLLYHGSFTQVSEIDLKTNASKEKISDAVSMSQAPTSRLKVLFRCL